MDAIGWVDSMLDWVRRLVAGVLLGRNTMVSADVSTNQRLPRGEAATMMAFSDRIVAHQSLD